MKINSRFLKSFLATAVALIVCTTTYAKNTFSDITDSNNKNITRTYDVSKGFESISSDLVGNIIFTQESEKSATLKIIAPEEYLRQIKVEVKNNILVLTNNSKLKNRKKIKGVTIYISAPTINSIKLDGVGNLTINNGLESNSLSLLSKGVGNINIKQLKCNDLTVDNYGVGNVTLTGTTKNVVYKSDGVGSIKAEDLKAETVKADCNGVGSITCYATSKLTARISGIGSIRYRGNPQEKVFNKDGIGGIKSL